MKTFDRAMAQRLEQAVADLERGCELEVVVRVVPASGNYRDIALAAALVGAFAMLGLVLFGPSVVDPLWVLPNAVLAALLSGWVGRSRWGSRSLTSSSRRRRQAEHDARSCFVDQAISGTRARTGVLVYASVLEGLVLVVPDLGASGAAPQAEWEAVRKRGVGVGALAERILAVLEGLAELGRARLPCSDDNPNELSDEPVIG